MAQKRVLGVKVLFIQTKMTDPSLTKMTHLGQPKTTFGTQAEKTTFSKHIGCEDDIHQPGRRPSTPEMQARKTTF